MIPTTAIRARKTNRLNEAFACVLLAGCAAATATQGPGQQTLASQSGPAPPASATALGAKGDSGTPSPQLAQRYPRYVIQREDVLLLTFPFTPELNQTVAVQPDGYINLQSAGSLHVQGLTVPELQDALKKAYVGILHNPIINVDLKDFQKPFFTVSGQVGKPGQYELRTDITVAEAIAVAGGLAPSAKTQVFVLHRASNEWVQVEKFNLKDVLNGKKVNEDPVIKPGDMIYVPNTFIANFRKYVPYGIDAGTYVTPNPF